ncbi:hypothetical protein HOK021_26160 [Streptomyces hygroscopicus]|nr:hypothetical protein HOK021_26160 [Streptomyces hygroscopicus]
MADVQETWAEALTATLDGLTAAIAAEKGQGLPPIARLESKYLLAVTAAEQESVCTVAYSNDFEELLGRPGAHYQPRSSPKNPMGAEIPPRRGCLRRRRRGCPGGYVSRGQILSRFVRSPTRPASLALPDCET